MVAYGLLIEIKVQAWNVMHQMPQKGSGPKQQWQAVLCGPDQ